LPAGEGAPRQAASASLYEAAAVVLEVEADDGSLRGVESADFDESPVDEPAESEDDSREDPSDDPLDPFDPVGRLSVL
jgi:hypothetical protein